MKLVRTTTLVFAEGRTERVYEIDLCEVGPKQFVVNFRYGKRGAPLKDGTKTVAPVAEAEATRIFEKVVTQQREKGYLPEGAPRPAPPVPARAAAAAAPASASGARAAPRQRDVILEKLAAAAARAAVRSRPGSAPQRGAGSIERVIWRAGELRIADAEPALLALVGTADALRDYCIAWALGRLGTRASHDTLGRLYGAPASPPHVRRIAMLALQELSDDATNEEFAAHLATTLPASLGALARGADPAALAAGVRAHVAEAGAPGWAVVETLYAMGTAVVRAAVVEQLREVPLEPPYFQHVRHVLKMAEYRRDGVVFGVLAHRFEKTKANFSHRNYMSYHHARGVTQPAQAYGAHTRRYLRRRVWRTLRREARAGDVDYVKMAVGVLLPFTDADAVPPRTSARTYGPWAPYWAFNWILHGASSRMEPAKSARCWVMKRGQPAAAPPPAVREEAFPRMWDARPEGLMHLLVESACAPVHDFAARAIRASTAFLERLDVDDVILLLARPYEPTARLGLELAEKRYDRNAPDLALLAGLAASVYAPARARAFTWIDEQRTRVLADSAFVAELVVARFADTREFARRLLRSSALAPATAAALLARVVARMLALPETPEADEAARAATATLVAALAAQLSAVDVAVAKDLLAHPLGGVQELGAELLLRLGPGAGAIPDDVMVLILHSKHENVRAVGMRMLAEMTPDVLANMELLLVRLTTDRNADLRNASRPLVARVAQRHPMAGETIGRALVEALLRRKLPEGAPSHVLAVLRDDLLAIMGRLAIDDVWRLLHSQSPHAQELGGILLQSARPETLTLEAIVKLASHDILAVRQAAWRFLELSEDRVRASMAEAARVLDAKWEDSRAFAFGFFRERLGKDAYDADVLVTILDSVREDVQAFGRELTTLHFREEDGPVLMAKLSEHPSIAVQVYTTNYLERYAQGRPEVLDRLVPYFTGVLSRVNRGRVAKQRVLAFLEAEGKKSEDAARLVLAILHRVSATIAVELRGGAVAAMVAIHDAQPGVTSPLKFVIPPVRGAEGGVPVRV